MLRWSVSIAASVTLLILAGIMWQYTGKQESMMTICDNSGDIKSCYLDKMNAVANRIEKLAMNLDQWNRQQVMTDVQNIIDAAGSDFESEIPEELPDNKAKLILSDYYRKNLEGLEMIAQRIQ